MSIHPRARAIVFAISMALLVVACSSVATQYPLSAEPRPVDKDRFEGIWLHHKEPLVLRFASNGIARIAGVEWKDDQFRLVQAEVIVTIGKKSNFLSVRFQRDGKWMDHYYFLQYHFTDQGDLLLWLPNAAVFKEAIGTNRLQGMVVKKGQYDTDITITNAPTALLEFIDAPENLTLFNYREPMVLRKISVLELPQILWREREKAEQPTPGDKK